MKGFVGTGGIFNFSANDHNGLIENAFEMLNRQKRKIRCLK